jgi:hypothetical protein
VILFTNVARRRVVITIITTIRREVSVQDARSQVQASLGAEAPEWQHTPASRRQLDRGMPRCDGDAEDPHSDKPAAYKLAASQSFRSKH